MGSILRCAWLAIAAMFLVGNAEPEEDGPICLTIAVQWRGDARDISDIRSIPVPASYRKLFESGGCTRFQLVEASLIDWNIAFGDERTTTLALAYLEADYLKGALPPERLKAELGAAYTDVRQAMAAASLQPPTSSERPKSEKRLRASKAARRADKAIAMAELSVQLAVQYVRAAELYGSAALLDKARHYFEPAEAGLTKFFPTQGPGGGDLREIVEMTSRPLDDLADLEMRIPILRARLSGAPEDIDAAAGVMRRHHRPVYETAADNARQHSGDPCELDDGLDEDLRALKTACYDLGNFRRSTIDYWRNRARLDLLMGARPEHYRLIERHLRNSGSDFERRPAPAPGAEVPNFIDSFETAAWLLRFEDAREQYPQFPQLDRRFPDLFLLLTERSRLALASPEPDAFGTALDFLAQATRQAPPPEAPALFRKAAEAWLTVWDRAAALEYAHRWRISERGRFAAYLRVNLDSLDAVAAGNGGALPAPSQ